MNLDAVCCVCACALVGVYVCACVFVQSNVSVCIHMGEYV